MKHKQIAFRVDKEDDDYIRSISKDICSMSEVYRTIFTSFCEKTRKNLRLKKGKKNAKPNAKAKGDGNKKRKDSSKGTNA